MMADLAAQVQAKVEHILRTDRGAVARAINIALSGGEMRGALTQMYGMNNAAFLGTYDMAAAAMQAHGDLRDWLNSLQARAAVYLHRYRADYGHWLCCFIGYDGRLEFWDSLGGKPDSLQIGQKRAVALGQATRALVNGLEGAAAYYNDYPIQSGATEVCGRWCLLRLVMRDMSEDRFAHYIFDLSRKFQVPPDAIVAAATL